MRIALAVALALAVTIVACTGDDSGSGGGSSQSGFPQAGCPAEPCTAGTVCFQQPVPSCNGTWYCWSSDQKWHCAAEDAGGPGGPPPDGAFMEEAGGSRDASPADASTTDAPGGS